MLIFGGGGFWLGRTTSQRPILVTPEPSVTPPTAAEPRVDDEASRILTRADLIALAAEASDALAARRAPSPTLSEAQGRRFAIRLPFGCLGRADEDSVSPMRWQYDKENKALRLHVAPVTWATDHWWPNIADAPVIEAIEGFWIERPWTGSESCLSTVTVGNPATGPADMGDHSLALGQFFGVGDARQGRRGGKAFEAVVKVPPEALQAQHGFRLRISGRIENVPGAGPLLCRQAAGSDQRPVCIIATAIDEVAIENGATGMILATWTMDRQNTVNRP